MAVVGIAVDLCRRLGLAPVARILTRTAERLAGSGHQPALAALRLATCPVAFSQPVP
jgi:hypothetical protein